MKKLLKRLIGAVFVISMALLGHFDVDNFELRSYQLVIAVFWSVGILRFMGCENELKEEIFDALKDLVVAIVVIPMWYLLSGDIENGLFEVTSVLIHFMLLMILVWKTQNSVKLSGKVAYYTNAVIPLIVLLLINFGVPETIAVIVAVVLPEPINYIGFKRKSIK